MSPALNTIEFCRSHGYSFFPIQPRSKKPYPGFSWKPFQTRLPTDEEVTQWITRWPDMNIAIVTGLISDLVVVDLDHHKGPIDLSQFELPKTFTIETGGGGEHYYYKFPAHTKVKNSTDFFPNVDIRGEGGYVIAPGSTHESGQVYSVLEDFPITNCPEWVFNTNNLF